MFDSLFAVNNGVTDFGTDLFLMIALGIVSLAVVFGGAWMIAAHINKAENTEGPAMIGKIKVSGGLTLVVSAGLFLRLLFTILFNGYLGRMAVYSSSNFGGLVEQYNAAFTAHESGLENISDFTLYPVPFFFSYLMGGLCKIFGELKFHDVTPAMQLFFRLPMILCDVASALLLFQIAKKYTNSVAALAVSGIFMLCPIFFFASGVWGSAFSYLTLLLLLSLYFMTQRNFLGLTISYSLALLTARDAMFLLPVFGVFTVYYFIKSTTAVKEQGKPAFKEWVKHKDLGLALKIPTYIVLSILLMYTLNAPMLADIDYSFFGWFGRLFIEPFTDIPFISYNGLAIYNLFNRNGLGMSDSIPQSVYSFLFAALATGLVIVIYLSKKNRANLVLTAAFTVFTLSIFYMGFSELNLVPFLAMLLLAFILIKDKRLLHVFGMVATTVVLNAAAVMIVAGYFSGVGIDQYAVSTYSGSALLKGNTFGTAVNAVCTVLTMLTYVYMTLIVLDITLSGNRKQFTIKGANFGDAMRDWFAIRG